MKSSIGPAHCAGIVALLIACGFLAWMDTVRAQRVGYVSKLVGTEAVADDASPTGFASGLRQMIVPEHNNDSYQWIVQTQQMLSQGEWRIRYVTYDNAPVGREMRSPSPYRWWLGLVAWFDHEFSGRPLGSAVEGAALLADPLLHILLLVGSVLFVAWQFGAYPAALLGLGLVTLFPFGGAFLPGQPGDGGLAQASGMWSVLLLLAAFRPIGDRAPDSPGSGKKTDRWYFLAGVAGGIGLWINAGRELPILVGIAVGGVAASLISRRYDSGDGAHGAGAAPWRAWSLGGAAASLAGFVIEYFPGYAGGMRLENNHPLYALAWLGAGELLECVTPWISGARRSWGRRTLASMAVALLPLATIAVLLVRSGIDGPLAGETLYRRLTNLSESPVADNTWGWIHRDGATGDVAATLLPVLVLLPAAWLLVRRARSSAEQSRIAVAIGPVMVSLGFALFRLSWWSMFDTALLALIVAIASAACSRPGLGRWICAGAIFLCVAPGLAQFLSRERKDATQTVTEGDVTSLVERDVSHWLSNQSDTEGAVVLAPPNLTAAMIFHGGLAGLGTPYWENKSGFEAAIRIAGASSADEAYALATHRNLSYIVVPTWDTFLDEYARLGANQTDHSLMALLHRWLPPRWLRPVPYHLPTVAGFEGQNVVIFKVVDVQDNATALSRLAEYFSEMGELDQAVEASHALRRLYSAHLGATVARARVERVSGDTEALAEATRDLLRLLSNGGDQGLPWDRRVSLAIALAEAKRFDLARDQLKRCVADIDEPRLRSLTTDSLYRMQQMSVAFQLPIVDERIRNLISKLLPAGLQNGR